MSELLRGPDLAVHDPTGPSSLGRLLGCPGSLRLSLNEPELKSEWSLEGDELHAAVAQALKTGSLPAELSEEKRTRCEACLEFVEEKLRGYKVLEQWIEHRVELVDGVNLVNYGTADLIVLTDKGLFVFDFKFGRKVHRHALVLQIANYSSAATTSIEELRTRPVSVHAYAYFPLYDESYLWHAELLHAEVPNVIRKVKEVIAGAHQMDAPVRPGPWCDYCNHLPNCKVVREQAALVKTHFQSTLPAEPGKVLELYDSAKLVDKQSSAVISRIKEILDEDPQAIPGLSYSEVNGARSVSDPIKFWEQLVIGGHLDGVQYKEECVKETVSVPKAEELYIKENYNGRQGPSKAALKERFAELTRDAIKQPRVKRLRRTSE